MLIQFVFSLVILLALIMTWRRMKQHAIRVIEVLFWSAMWIAALVVLWEPNLSTRAANFVGIGRGADFVLYGSTILLFILTFRLYVAHDRIERIITEIVRQEALRNTSSGEHARDCPAVSVSDDNRRIIDGIGV